MTLDEDTKDNSVDYILERLIKDYLHVREKWVTNLAYWGHQTKQFAEDILNKLTLAENKDTSNIILGKLVHSKNFIPFFPQYRSKDGAQYDFNQRDITVKNNVKVIANIS